jgi:hypothetical protein
MFIKAGRHTYLWIGILHFPAALPAIDFVGGDACPRNEDALKAGTTNDEVGDAEALGS